MRNRVMTVTAALLLASATLAMAQTEQKKTPPAAPATTEDTVSLGTIDFGVRGISVTGDKARFMRYQDLRNGANINLALGKQTSTHEFSLNGSNLGYKDENINASFVNKMVNVTAFFDQLPLNYGLDGMTRTPWVESSKGVWTLDAAARAAVEAKTATGVLCAPGLAATATCNVSTAAAVLGYPSIYRNLAKPFDITAQRDTFGFGVGIAAAKDVDVDVTFQSAKKSGNQPYGMSFAFNNANELPMSLDNRTNDYGFGVSWGGAHGMVRLAYDRSVFTQNIASVTWDNPIRATDWNDGQAIDGVNGPWDPSAYSNGNGPARGRIAMAPSNTLDMMSATAVAHHLPAHSTFNASVSFGSSKQNDAFIPWTINPVIANSATYAWFPGLASLPRSSAQAQMDIINAVFNFTSRPAPWAGVTARYRYSDRKDRMPQFVSDSTVRFDGVPEGGIATPLLYETEALNATRTSLNVDATFTPIPFTAIRFGMGNEKYEHSARAFAVLNETTIRSSIDTVGNQYVQVRAIFERSRRVGEGFDEAAIPDGGGQPASRWYDDADRTRDRGTLLLTISPLAYLDITGSYASGNDKYDEAEQAFGLLSNKNTSTNAGITVTPNSQVAFGANYGQDTFNSLQRSRTANPFSGVAGAYESWNDPNREWSLATDEKVKNFDLFLDLFKLIPNADLRFAYTYSDSNNSFIHGGPRITALLTNAILTPGDTKPCATGYTSCFEPLPNVTNKWQRLTADAKIFVNKRVDLGVSYWYEKLDVSDYAAINNADGTPRIDYLGALTTGYGSRPYKGSTFFGRVIVKL
ncbi:MAG: MtrB/PioB family outer membrane beta-barrel protein [Acidobacteria bacterium]|nr:MtrB/PioB family outer membrane beta-barrel protein [Acidobacteriota bacterium]